MTAVERAFGIASAVAGGLTAYIVARTLWIWRQYVKGASGNAPKDTLAGLLQNLIRQNPPQTYPARDLFWAAVFLAMASAAVFVLGLMVYL